MHGCLSLPSGTPPVKVIEIFLLLEKDISGHVMLSSKYEDLPNITENKHWQCIELICIYIAVYDYCYVL